MKSIAERWAEHTDALNLPVEMSAALWPTFMAGFLTALRAVGDLDEMTPRQREAAVTAWYDEAQRERRPAH